MNDILLDSDNDLNTRNGDLDIGTSDAQNQKLLLITNKNDWKQHPTAGVGLDNYLSDEGPENLFREIRAQFVADGMKVNTLKLTDEDKIGIDANY